MTNEETLAEKRTQLSEVNAAITRILTGAQEFSLDTGQTRQTVKRANLETLTAERSRLEEEIRVLEARGCGSVVNVVPGY